MSIIRKAMVEVRQKYAAAWEGHANPWSVWTRYATFPLVILAIWSRVWLGWWALLPVSAGIVWLGVNPLVFRQPRSFNNWASKAVLGERIWLGRRRIDLPVHHRRVPTTLAATSAFGMPFVAWGLYTLAVWPTVFGAAWTLILKSWFNDRMVWLYEDFERRS